jgi:type IV pilus biogenesis protein CpaD/CtpE
MIRTLLASASALTLCACATETGRYEFYSDEANVQFGSSVEQNIAAQTVNPDGAEGDVTANGQRVGTAQERYRADKVEKPKPAGTLQSTTSGQGGGNQGGGGNNQ